MKLALVIYGDLHQTTGGYLYDRKLVDYLRSQGDTVDVHSIRDHGYYQNLLRHNAATHLKAINPEVYDAVLIDELCHSALATTMPRLRSTTCTIGLVHHLKASEPQSPLSKWCAQVLERQFLKHQHGLLCNSATTVQTCDDLLGMPLQSCVAVPGTITSAAHISPQQIAQRAHSERPLNILFLGTLTPRKGLHYLLEALEQCSKPVKLSVVGSPDRDTRYARRCSRMAHLLEQHTVVLRGEIDTPDLVKELESADILAVPSDYEGYGIAYLEGFSAGLPCIATAEGAPPEFVKSGINGYTVRPGDTSAIADCINQLNGNLEKLAKMSQAARETFDQHPSWEQSFKNARQFIEKTIRAFEPAGS